MAKGIAVALLAISLALLIIYGADVLVASYSAGNGTSVDRRGFLPFDESVRGGAFGGGAVILSIIAFLTSRKEYAPVVSTLLLINGGLIIAGMLALIGQGALSSENSAGAVPTVASTIGMGVILIALGIWKSISDKKVLSAAKRETTHK